MMAEAITAERIVEAARSYCGVRFVHAGRSRLGLDCIGLLIVVGRDCGIVAPGFDRTDYGSVINTETLRAELEVFCERVPRAQMQVGDVLLFRVRRSPQHVAIVSALAPQLRYIHACTSIKRVVEQRLDSDAETRLAAVLRWKGLAR